MLNLPRIPKLSLGLQRKIDNSESGLFGWGGGTIIRLRIRLRIKTNTKIAKSLQYATEVVNYIKYY